MNISKIDVLTSILNGGSYIYRFVVIIEIKESQVVSISSQINRRCRGRRRRVNCIFSSFERLYSSYRYLCNNYLNGVRNDSSNCLFVHNYVSESWWPEPDRDCSDRWRVLLTNIGYYLEKAFITVYSIDKSTNRSLKGSSVDSSIRWKDR